MQSSRPGPGMVRLPSTALRVACALVALITMGVCLEALAQSSPLEAIAVPRVIVADPTFAYAPSAATGSASWSAEFISREMVSTEQAERAASFYVDRELPGELRASTRDYAGSGFDMGHLAPDADASEAQGKIARARLSNVVPQSPGLNRGLWRKLEEHVRELAREHGAVFVVTAPVYAKQGSPRLVGNLVAPSHLVKCVLVLNVDETKLNGGQLVPPGILRVAEIKAMHGWIVPNQTPPAGATLDAFRRPVDACEELLQLDLFSWVDDATEIRMEASR